jgi:hypothetical protein
LTSTARPAIVGDDLGDYDRTAQRVREATPAHLHTPSARALRRWADEGVIGRFKVGRRTYISFTEVLETLRPRRVER